MARVHHHYYYRQFTKQWSRFATKSSLLSSSKTNYIQRHYRPNGTDTFCCHYFSSYSGHGQDILGDTLTTSIHDNIPKIILRGHSESGFDVVNLVKNMDPNDKDLQATGGVVHLCGSILCFPTSCYLWKNVTTPQDVTIDKLAPVLLYRPKLEYIFVGSQNPVSPKQIHDIKNEFVKIGHDEIVVEQMDLTNALGTFNILNAEDRLVAAALVLPQN